MIGAFFRAVVVASTDITSSGPAVSEPAPVIDAPARPRPRRPGDRFRNEERHEFRYHLSIALAMVCSWLIFVLPHRVRLWLADQAGKLWYRLAPTYRANVRANISQVVGSSVPEAALEAMVRRVFKMSARNFADLLRLRHTSERDLIRTVPLGDELWTVLDSARTRGQGVVLLTGHLGAFDVVGHAIAARGLPLIVVTGRTTARFIFDAVTFLRRSRRMLLVEATPAGVRNVIRALRRGECAAFLADYDFFQNGLPVTFFGAETTLPPGPIRLARDTGALVVSVFGLRSNGGYTMTLGESFTVEKTHDLDADMQRGMERVVAVLERAIAATPDQWVMFQRVWPLEPVDPVRVFPVGSPLESDLLKRVDAVLPPPRHDAP